jgi:hypothetical protein
MRNAGGVCPQAFAGRQDRLRRPSDRRDIFFREIRNRGSLKIERRRGLSDKYGQIRKYGKYGDTHSFPFFPRDELHSFAIRSRRQIFSTGAALPLSVTHQAVDLMEA